MHVEANIIVNAYNVLTILIVLAAVFSYVNFRFIKLPMTIGVTLMALLCSIVILAFGRLYPSFLNEPVSLISSLDFELLIMKILLSFLLFAGAIQIDIQKLSREIVPIVAYSSLAVLISTVVIGGVMFYVFELFNLAIPFIYCLVFGALISPTDAIALLAVLKKTHASSPLSIRIVGESLFNDGMGVVIFVTLLELVSLRTDKLVLNQVLGLFLRDACGGIIWGFALGYIGYYLLKSIDHYQVEVLITIAMVMGGFLFANYLRISGPLAMVVAGIITGSKGKLGAMSDITQDYVNKFWEIVDEILNVIIFLLIGFEMITFTLNLNTLWIGLVGIAVVLVARYISVFLPTLLLSFYRPFDRNSIFILTWGGLRGALSLALALSLPKSDYRNPFVLITYIIVVFSILVQGLTIGKLARNYVARL